MGEPTGAPAGGRGRSGRRLETAACAAVALAAGLFYMWTAQQPADSWAFATRVPQSYYPMQAAGFRSGHLYVSIEPHPALLALKDPYDPVANAPYRVHDMSLYRGHYYLYYGVTPVLILFWPFAALTGLYPLEPAAVALFCTGAIWTGIALLVAIKRRHFPAAPGVVLVAAAVCLSFATPLSLLVEAPQFYQVPISCAIFLQALMLAAVYCSLHSERRRMAWLAAAGLLFGLAMGARPNYLLGSVALLVPILAHARAAGGASGRGRLLLRGLAFTFAPVLACGIGLLAYNWARFGSVAEFGMHYQLAGERVMKLSAIKLGNLGPHLREYLFNPGLWQSYFPFFGSWSGQPYGMLRYVPWMWLSLAAFLPWGAGGPGGQGPARAFALTAAVASLANLALLSSFYGAMSRYPGDYANAGLLVAGVGALALGQRAAAAGRAALASAGLAAVAAVSLFFGLAVYFDGFPAKDTFLGLARAADWPAYAWERAKGHEFGGLRLELRLPQKQPALPEPLFETGPQADQRDWLQIEYISAASARLSVFHAGTGAFASREFPIPKDRRIVVEARCGSLFPPFSHPLFAKWTRDDYDAARRDLQLTVNGTEVLRAELDCYPSSPANLLIGRLGWFSGGMEQTFSGEVLGVGRLPLLKPEKAAPLFRSAGPVELKLVLPSGKASGADPLLLTGKGIQSDLLYCVYDGTNQIKFALDHYGNGGPQSESVSYDPLVPHTLMILIGSMAGQAYGRLFIAFDGRTLLNVEQTFYPSDPTSVILGFNAYGSSTAGHQFTGRIAGFRQVSAESLPPLEAAGSYGAIEMSVNFPLGVSGTGEPLVVTGVTGAGDFIYVRYLDPSHIRVGFDHWGIGGIVGDPFELDYGRPHRLSITFGALYPPGSPSQLAKTVKVRIDGRIALQGTFPSYPSRSDQIVIGANRIGGSNCGPLFTGRILAIERFPAPRD